MKLGVNIDHIATLRQVRQASNPEPVFAAAMAEEAGADSIVAHLREDRRHIQDKDVFNLRKSVRTRFNLEMSVAAEIVKIACQLKPDQATLVPEKRKEITTEGGLDVAGNLKKISCVKEELERCGIDVSLFIDPEKKQIDAAKKIGVKMVELHTGRYAEAKNKPAQKKMLDELKIAAHYALEKNLSVFAGHGLDYFNVAAVSKIKAIEELNIGYSIICRAALVGIIQAVREMKAITG